MQQIYTYIVIIRYLKMGNAAVVHPSIEYFSLIKEQKDNATAV